MVIYPGDWKKTTLGKEYVIIMGQSPTSSSYNDSKNGLPLIQGNADIENGITSTKRYTSQPTKICDADSVIMSVRAPVGTISRTNQRVCLGRGVCAIVGKITNFVYYLMKYHEKSWQKLEQGSTFTAVSGKVIRDFEIVIPPNESEQTAIADTLAAFDTHITNLTELITKKKAIRDGALDELMTGRTRLKGFCGDWEVKRLLDCVRLVQGLTYAPNNVSSYGTLVLRSSNIQDNSLSLEDNVYVNMQIAQEKMIQEGDILVCVRNGSSDLIGKSCRLPALSNTTFGAFMSVLRGDKTGYIAKIFNSLIVQKQVRNRTSATINQITKKDFEDIIIPLPPLDEQIAIADTLSALDKEISSLETERAKISQIRDGAMNDLLTGKVRLNHGN